jgi:hypothetical protein
MTDSEHFRQLYLFHPRSLNLLEAKDLLMTVAKI